MEERALTQELDELGAEEGLEVHGSGRPNKKQQKWKSQICECDQME